MRLLIVLGLVLAGCGGSASTPTLVDAFGEAGVTLNERELNDGRIAWSSDSDEHIIVEVIEAPNGSDVQQALVFVPALSGDGTNYPGSRYVAVLDEHLANGLTDWIADETTGRGGGSWSETRLFGEWEVEIENDRDFLQSFTVRVKRAGR